MISDFNKHFGDIKTHKLYKTIKELEQEKMLKVTDTYCDYKHEPFQDLDLEGAMAFGQVPDMGAEKKMVLKALTDLRNNGECMWHDNLTDKDNVTPYFKHRGFIYEFIS